VLGFSSLEGVEPELAERLVGEGFLSYDDLSVIEPDALTEMGGLTVDQVDRIVQQAELKAAEAEKAAAEQRRQQREQDRLEAVDAAEAKEKAEANEESEGAADESAYYDDGKPAEIIEQATIEAAGQAAVRTVPKPSGGEEAAEPSRQRPAETSDDAIP